MSARTAAWVVAVAIAALSPARAAVPLASQSAVYDLALSAAPGGRIVSASGRMTYEVRETCDAWSSSQTLSLDTTDRDGQTVSTRSDDATFETKDGRRLDFAMTQRDGDKVTDDLRGVATRADARAPVIARFTHPAGLVLVLPPGTLFPMAQDEAIITAAESGTRSLAPLLFDGTGTDGAQETAIRILGWDRTPAAPAPTMAGMRSGRVHIAFFPAGSHDMLPDYEIGQRIFANGVSDALDLDFGSFTVHGDLAHLQLRPQAAGCALRTAALHPR